MIEEGKPAPDFTLADQAGKKVTLSKLYLTRP
jgi:peroxiredoxin